MAKFPHTASGGSFRMPFSKSTSSVAAKLCTNASCPNMGPAMIWSTNQLLCQLGPKKSWGHSQRLQWLTVSSGWSNASHAHTNSNEPWWTYQVETNETSRLQAPVALELAERRIPEENPRCRLGMSAMMAWPKVNLLKQVVPATTVKAQPATRATVKAQPRNRMVGFCLWRFGSPQLQAQFHQPVTDISLCGIWLLAALATSRIL